MHDLAVIILAAGKGKRMRNAALPKVLHTLHGKPLIDYVVETAMALQPQHLIVVVGYLKEKVQTHLRQRFPDTISFAEQPQQLGTGDAVLQAAPLLQQFTGTVLVLNGDVPLVQVATLQQLLHQHWKNSAIVSVLTTELDDPAGYGRIVRDENGGFLRIIEEKDASEEERQIREVNTGIMAVETPPLFELLREVRPNNAQGEYYLTDIIAICRKHGYPVQAVPGAHPIETYGVNRPEHLQFLEQFLSSQPIDSK